VGDGGLEISEIGGVGIRGGFVEEDAVEVDGTVGGRFPTGGLSEKVFFGERWLDIYLA
jgi:hypothetical protein